MNLHFVCLTHHNGRYIWPLAASIAAPMAACCHLIYSCLTQAVGARWQQSISCRPCRNVSSSPAHGAPSMQMVMHCLRGHSQSQLSKLHVQDAAKVVRKVIDSSPNSHSFNLIALTAAS